MIKNTNKYKLRKLSIGLVSVYAGVLLMQSQQKVTKADVVNNVNKTQLTVQTNSESAKANLANSRVQNSNSTVGEQQNKTVENVRTNLANANNVSQKGVVGQTQKANVNYQKSNGSNSQVSAISRQKLIANKYANEAANNNIQSSNKVENNNLVASKAPQTSSAVENKNEVENTNINANLAQKSTNVLNIQGQKANAINQKSLLESKAVNSTANGGFDEKIWGKLDVNQWNGSVVGNYYQLNSYTGDANHVIVPNEADFEKAGISTGGKQVGVSSDFMHSIFLKTTAQNATWAFSKTGGKKIKTIKNANGDNNWINAWGHTENGESISGKLSKFDGSSLDVSDISDMGSMFQGNNLSDLSSLSDWNTSNVTDMDSMFDSNQISDLTPLKNWDTSKVTNMSNMFQANQISNLTPLANWKTSNITDMSAMFNTNQISDLTPLKNWDTSKVTNMSLMFQHNQISNLSPLANWKTSNITDMSYMFNMNQISNLTPLKNWDTSKVTDMSYMFNMNQISNLTPLNSWNVKNVSSIYGMFNNNNHNTQKSLPAGKRTIIVTNPDGAKTTIIETVNFYDDSYVTFVTKSTKPDNKVSDWATLQTLYDLGATATDGQNSTNGYYNTYSAPVIAGYTANQSEVGSKQAQSGDNIIINITYKANPLTATYTFVDDENNGSTVGSPVVVNGVTNQKNVKVSLSVPANYVLVAGQTLPTKVDFGTSNQTISIHIVHAKQTITYNHPSTTLSGAKQTDLNSVGTRTIIFNFPSNYKPLAIWINKYANGQNTITHSGNTYTIVQTIHFVRNAVLDKVTNKLTYINPGGANAENYSAIGHETDNWGLRPGDSDEYSPVIIPKINGYKAKLSTNTNKNGLMMFAVSFMALPTKKPTEPVNNNQIAKPAQNNGSSSSSNNSNQSTISNNNQSSSSVVSPIQPSNPVNDDVEPSNSNIADVDNANSVIDEANYDTDDDLDTIPAETHVRATHDGVTKDMSNHIKSSSNHAHSAYKAPKSNRQAQTINHIAQALRLVDSNSKGANEAPTNYASIINNAVSSINPITAHTAYADTIKPTDNAQTLKAHSQASSSHMLPQTGENADEVIASLAGALAEASAITALAGTRKKRA